MEFRFICFCSCYKSLLRCINYKLVLLSGDVLKNWDSITVYGLPGVRRLDALLRSLFVKYGLEGGYEPC